MFSPAELTSNVGVPKVFTQASNSAITDVSIPTSVCTANTRVISPIDAQTASAEALSLK